MKIKHIVTITGLLTVMTATTPLLAETSAYRYLEAQHTQIDHSDGDLDNGLGIEVSIPLTDNWYVTGSNTKNDFTTDTGVEGEFTNWFLGAGYAWQLSNENSLYLQVSAETQKLTADIATIDERGASIELGNHYQLNESWVFSAHARFSDINIADDAGRSDEFYFGARIDYQLNDNFQLGLGYETGEFDRADFALRFNF